MGCVFQSPCGDSMWTTRFLRAENIRRNVSIPLRGFHVDNGGDNHGKETNFVSIPLRGFHVDNAEAAAEAAAYTRFNPLAGIPCGQRRPLRWPPRRRVSIPLRGFHVDNAAIEMAAETAAFQSPCGDSMWTTLG